MESSAPRDGGTSLSCDGCIHISLLIISELSMQSDGKYVMESHVIFVMNVLVRLAETILRVCTSYLNAECSPLIGQSIILLQ